MKITGTVVYQDLEGGFWGIRGDDDEQYFPIDGLPASAQQDGLRVEADVEPANAMSFTMWGRNVRVRDLRTL